MDITRHGRRIAVDIAITVITVLDSAEARIIDISEHGAQIVGASMVKGTKFQIEYAGQTVYAQCMWSEVDRMGVRFPFDLTDGPLHDALIMAATSAGLSTEAYMPPPGFTTVAPSRAAIAAFGRRNSA